MQPIARQFYRWTYISLGLACTCLGYAELDFLPSISAFNVVVLVLLFAAYRMEGRWSLSIRAANLIGGVIGVLAIVWVVYQFTRPNGDFGEELVPPSARLPYLGPLLMILVPAKLFRPKHVGDFWGLQGIGVIAVALGCALTSDPIFGVLMLAYLVSTVCSLTLFYYYRQAQRIGPVRTVSAPPRVLLRAGGWAAGVVAIALVLFLCTPRVTEARWEIAGTTTRIQTGVDDTRPTIDLNNSGSVTINRDKVFEVRAFTEDRPNPPPKLDVDPNQRWQQSRFNYYSNGRWEYRDIGHYGMRGSRRSGGATLVPELKPIDTLANLGPGQYYFEFRISHPSPGALIRVRAEPIASPYGPDGKPRTIVAARGAGSSRYSWYGQPNGEMSPPAFLTMKVYDQVVLPSQEPGVGGPEPFEDSALDQLRSWQTVPHIRAWSQELLRTLVDRGRLPHGVLGGLRSVPMIPAWAQDPILTLGVRLGCVPPVVMEDLVPPVYYEAVAREFEWFLARSGQFRYSLSLTRRDPDVDPIEDFLLNTRKGHCTRFATALALMLRAVGVPTEVILGYKGFETTGNGVYDILQCHAHSWVRAVIFRPSSRTGESSWRWLTLDPTPSAEDEARAESSWGQWWATTRHSLASFFKNFIVEYDADQQERTRYALVLNSVPISQRLFELGFGPDGDNWPRAVGIGLAAVAAVIGGRRLLRSRRGRRRAAPDPATALYQRLVRTLAAAGEVPLAWQTPKEFAAAAGRKLHLLEPTRALASVPDRTVDLYYAMRYGNRPPDVTELRAANTRVDELAAVLGPVH
jgi:hypothetical protein